MRRGIHHAGISQYNLEFKNTVCEQRGNSRTKRQFSGTSKTIPGIPGHTWYLKEQLQRQLTLERLSTLMASAALALKRVRKFSKLLFCSSVPHSRSTKKKVFLLFFILLLQKTAFALWKLAPGDNNDSHCVWKLTFFVYVTKYQSCYGALSGLNK